MLRRNRWLIIVLSVAGLYLSACAQAPATKPKVDPVVVATIEGSDFKRLTLTEKAAERIDLQTATVREEAVTRRRIVWGEVVQGADDDPGSVLVRLRLSESDLSQIDQRQPALVTPDIGDSNLVASLTTHAIRTSSTAEVEEDMAGQYYEVEDANHGLTPGQIVRVELTLLGNGKQQKIVPYAAVIYGLQGETWVYTNPEPLVFVRESIAVDYIEGEQAVLLEGPPAGVAVVTVGGAELYGAETGVSK